MKALLLPIKPKWCALMMNGDKTVEVRKENVGKAVQKLIDENGYADIYVYCSKGKPNLWLPYEYDCFELDEASQPYLSDKPIVDIDTKMNGKVAFKFRCYKVEEINTWFERDSGDSMFYTNDLEYYELEKKSCLSLTELQNYFTKMLDEDKDTVGYAIHISDLEIFDEPKELSEFNRYSKCKRNLGAGCLFCHATCTRTDTYCNKPLTKVPQSFCYIEVEK